MPHFVFTCVLNIVKPPRGFMMTLLCRNYYYTNAKIVQAHFFDVHSARTTFDKIGCASANAKIVQAHFCICARLALSLHLQNQDFTITSKYNMINAQDIKNGTCIRMDGRLYFCVEFLHVKPGKGNTFMRTKLKDVVDGRVLERRFNIGEKLEDVRVERRPYQYLYQEGGDDIFMNNETFEQIPIAKDLVTGSDFMKEGDTVEVVSDASTDTVLYAEMPVKTVLKVTYTEPGLKGDTATNTLKPATVETGATVKVPLFINEGELIEVDTRDGSYVGRVK